MESFPCQNKGNCPQQAFKRGCYEDVHHQFWPASNYRSSVEKDFRELDSNKELTCRQRHNDEHALRPPEKPSREVMLQALGYIAQEGAA